MDQPNNQPSEACKNHEELEDIFTQSAECIHMSMERLLTAHHGRETACAQFLMFAAIDAAIVLARESLDDSDAAIKSITETLQDHIGNLQEMHG